MTRIEIAEKIADTMKILQSTKGNDTFTAKEYKQFRKNGLSLQTLRDHHFIKVNYSETFTKTVPNFHSHDYMFNNQGQIIMERYEYNRLPEIAKKALIKINNDQPLIINCPKEITITGKRYYYIADYDRMKDSIQDEWEYLIAKKEEKEQELIEINDKIAEFQEFFK